MSCFKEKLRCAFGPRPCFICCAGPLKESTTTRLSYTAILIMVVISATASHEDSFFEFLYSKYSHAIDLICSHIHGGPKCSRISGFIGIYRLCLPLFFFHIVMMVFTIAVPSSQTIRGKIHNGFWVWKILVLISLYAAAYSFPVLEEYVKIWMMFGIVGGLIFVYVQHITLIDFAYEVNGIWHAKSKKSMRYTVCLYVCTLLMYCLTAAAYAFLLFWYGLSLRCTLNLAVLGINGCLTALFAICSAFSNTLRRKQLWLPGAITSAFVAFLTWTALSSQPRTLSAEVPWQKTIRPRNLTGHPLFVVADHLNRLMSEQFDGLTTTPSTVDSNNDSLILPAITVNQCLPQGVSSLSQHVGKDLLTFIGLILVIGGSLYSSFRTTLQARRLGIRTRRERLKRILFPIQERPEPSDDNEDQSRRTRTSKDFDEAVGNGYLTIKEVKRQERALNMLAAAVADLPNPKVFRRPTMPLAREQTAQQFHPRTSLIQASPRAEQSSFHAFAAQGVSQSVVQPTLRESSSVPDLTLTMRRLGRQRRVSILNFDWTSPSHEIMPNGHHTSGRRRHPPADLPSVQASGWAKFAQAEYAVDAEANRVQPLDKKHKKPRPDTKRFPSRPVRRPLLSPIQDDSPMTELSHFPTTQAVFGVDGYSFPDDRLPSEFVSSIPKGDQRVPLPSKRSQSAQYISSPYTVLLDSLTDQTVALSSPKHLRYELARSASDLVLGRRMSRLLESQPELADSFAFLRPMFNTAAPRDEYVIYNEFIAPVYSYAWFHFIYAISTLYLMAQLTNWYNPHISRVETLSGSWANMWMKLTSSWIALILYAWTIACPRFCIGRKLGDTPLTPRTPRSRLTSITPV